MTTNITRADLQQAFGNKPKLIRFFEQLFVSTTTAGQQASAATEATGAIQDATVVTLGPNAAFNNERILTAGAGIVFDTSDGTTVTVSLLSVVATNGGFACTFNLAGDTNLDLPVSGRVPSSADGPYADDTAAAAAGVPLGGWYAKPAGVLAWRQV